MGICTIIIPTKGIFNKEVNVYEKAIRIGESDPTIYAKLGLACIARSADLYYAGKKPSFLFKKASRVLNTSLQIDKNNRLVAYAFGLLFFRMAEYYAIVDNRAKARLFTFKGIEFAKRSYNRFPYNRNIFFSLINLYTVAFGITITLSRKN